MPTGLTEDKWVIGYEVKPGNPRVVHHTLNYFDTTGQARAMEKKQLAIEARDVENGKILTDRGPGYYAGMGVGFVAAGGSRNAPTFGGIGGWAPGMLPQFVPERHRLAASEGRGLPHPDALPPQRPAGSRPHPGRPLFRQGAG